MNVNKILICAFSIIYMLHGMPMLGYRYPSMAYAAIIIALFFVLLLNIGVKSVLKIFPIFIIPILDVLISSSNALTFFQGVSTLLQSLMMPMLALYLYKGNHRKMAAWLFSIYLGINFITCITTYFGCQIFPNASRELVMADATESPFYYMYLNANIGGFGFVYSMVLLLVLAICTIKNNKYIAKGRLMLIFAIMYVVGIVMTVIAAEYTTALLLACASLLLLFVRSKFNVKRIIIWCVSFLFVFWAFKPLISSGLMTIADNVESATFSHRLSDLALSLDGRFTQENSDLDAREATYTKSLTSFIENPLGGWNLKSTGGHSYFFDALAKYGIFGLLLVILTLKIIYINYVKPLRTTFVYGYANIAFLLITVMAIVNPRLFTDFVLFVVPIYVMLLVNKGGYSSRKFQKDSSRPIIDNRI